MTEFKPSKACGRIQQQIESYVDQELSGDAMQQVEDHMAGCAACAAELALAQEVKSTLAVLPALECPDDVFLAALQRIEAEDSADRHAFLFPWRWGAVLATVAMLLFVLYGALQFQAPGDTPPTQLVEETDTSQEDRPEADSSLGGTSTEDVLYSQENLEQAGRQLEVALALVGHNSQRGSETISSLLPGI